MLAGRKTKIGYCPCSLGPVVETVGVAAAGGADVGVLSPGALSGLGAPRLGPQLFLGSVPAMKAIMTGFAQVPATERSTGTSTTPSGTGKSSTGEQIGRAHV